MRKCILLGIGLLLIGTTMAAPSSHSLQIGKVDIGAKTERGIVTFSDFNAITDAIRTITDLFSATTGSLTEIFFDKKVQVRELCFGSDCATKWPVSPTAMWATNGSNVSRTAGNVGIGVANPTAKLQVAGNLEVSGQITQGGAPLIPSCSEGQAIVFSAGKLGCGSAADMFAWTATNFSACTCSGTKSRTVACKKNGTDKVTDAECSGVKPEANGVCTTPSSCYTWSQSGYGSCNCSGIQTQTVTCKNGSTTVADSLCPTLKPAPTKSCAASASCYTWKQSGFSTCSCSTGTESQTVTCSDSDGKIVADSYCSGDKPKTSQSCTKASSCFAWVESPYSACSCSGEKTRSVVCKNGSTDVADSFCKTAKPAIKASCSAGGSCYVWSTGTPGTCDCYGKNTRTVVCKNGTATVSDSLCSGTKPSAIGSCTVPSSCFAWDTANWGSCSCSGTETRTTSCKNTITGLPGGDTLCGPKPSLSQSCSAPSSCYTWKETVSPTCNCDTQTQAITYECMNGSTIVSNSLCPTGKKLVAKNCTAPDSCYNAYCQELAPSCTIDLICERGSTDVPFSECMSRDITTPTESDGTPFCLTHRDCEDGRLSCFVAGTQVTLANGEKKNIEDVNIKKDILRGKDGKYLSIGVKYKIAHKGNIYSVNGSEYFFTETHPFMTTDGWKSFNPIGSQMENPGMVVGLLQKGDLLVKNGGTTEEIKDIKFRYEETFVYNFGLRDGNTFYANDYLVHNVDLTEGLYLLGYYDEEGNVGRQPEQASKSIK